MRGQKDAKESDFFACTPRAEAMRILLTAATLLRYTILTTDSNVAFMQTTVTEGHEILVKAQYVAEKLVWKLRRSLYGMREAALRLPQFFL